LVRRLRQCLLSRLCRQIRRVDRRDKDKIEDERKDRCGIAGCGVKARFAASFAPASGQ
jgi:hypothetical protein